MDVIWWCAQVGWCHYRSERYSHLTYQKEAFVWKFGVGFYSLKKMCFSMGLQAVVKRWLLPQPQAKAGLILLYFHPSTLTDMQEENLRNWLLLFSPCRETTAFTIYRWNRLLSRNRSAWLKEATADESFSYESLMTDTDFAARWGSYQSPLIWIQL